jgi:hypothetical protein
MKKLKEIPEINYHQLKEEGEEEERFIFNLQPPVQLALLIFIYLRMWLRLFFQSTFYLEIYQK